jgi:hypothetical protein
VEGERLMSTPKLRDDEIAMVAQPRAMCVTTTRNMPSRRYHYVAGGWAIWRRTAEGSREPIRLAVHTRCRQWISMPDLVDEAPFSEICDLCMLYGRRSFDALTTSGQVDF